MSSISPTSHIASALEDFYISGDSIGSRPLYDAVQDDDFSRIKQLISLPSLSLKDLGESLVEAAYYDDPTIINILVTCPKINEIDPSYVSHCLMEAQPEESIKALLTIKLVNELPAEALSRPFTRCCFYHFFNPFKTILKLKNVKEAIPSHMNLTSIFYRITESCGNGFMFELLESPLGRNLPLNEGYISALKSRNLPVAKIIRAAAGKNFSIQNSGEALYWIAKFNDYEEFKHLIQSNLIPKNYIAGTIRIALKYGSIEIARHMLCCLKPDILSNTDKVVLGQLFWAGIYFNNNEHLHLFVSSPIIHEIITSEDLANCKKNGAKYYKEYTIIRNALLSEEYLSGDAEVKKRLKILELV